MKYTFRLLALFSFVLLCNTGSQAQSVWTNGSSGTIYYNGGKVGIGTSSPNYSLEIENSGSTNNQEYLLSAFNHSGNAGGVYIGYLGDGTGAQEARVRSGGNIPLALGTSGFRDAIYIANDGLVGIGRKAPTQRLDVAGITYLRSAPTHTVEVEQLRIGRNDIDARYHSLYSQHTGSASSNYLQFRIHDGNSNDGSSQTTVMHMTGAGHVGIGTTDTHGYQLAVAGGVLAEKVQLDQQANWPDYVFNSKYNLRSLEDTEAFIEEHQHLPEIPSAAEVENNGYDLGQMNAKLLQKIEELTLHLIDQNKQIKDQNSQIDLLIQDNKALRSDVESLKQAGNH